ncbi:MAG TPA: D-2-hydroxyacid dehydrogenase [Marmoricola sp.]
MTAAPTTVLIATPLEEDLVERIRSGAPEVEVLHDAALLPAPRYPSDHGGDPAFRRSPEAQRRFDAWVQRAEVTLGVPGETPDALRDLVAGAPHLRWVQGTAAGAGQQVRAAGLSAADLERVTFTSSVGVHATQLAEWAMLGLLTFTKDLPRLQRDKASRRWDHYAVRELAGQRLLVVGLGHIGREVSRAARALGMHVTGVRRTGGEQDLDAVDRMVSTGELAEVVPTADAVVLALPATVETEGMFTAELIKALPEHAVLVNVGRGSTIDEAALVSALREGRLAGAALDVVATEPLPAESPLWELDNVLLSPHTAALSTRENARIVELFCDNLRRFRTGAPLRNVVDTRLFY